MKRVVCGYDDRGNATVLASGPPPVTITGDQLGIHPDFRFQPIWTARRPDLSTVDETPTDGTFHLAEGVGAVAFHVGTFPPDDQPQVMHRTDTVDYLVIVSGGINLKMADGTEIDLEAGDVVVQIGAEHQWWVKGNVACVIAFVTVGVSR